MHVFKRKRRTTLSQKEQRAPVSGWASVGMPLAFRAEVMPGRERDRRIFTVARVLDNGRVELTGMSGEHTMMEFEPVM